MMTDISIGHEGPAFEMGPLTRTDFVRYAGASNDFNPIHHDDKFARSAGQPSVFGHGMLSAGLLGSYLTGWFGRDCVRRLQVRFVERVWPGDVVRARGTVTDRDAATAEIELVLEREDRTPLVKGVATVWINHEELR